VKSRLKPTDDIFKRTLSTGRFLFLLDGYDEIFSTKKQAINRQIETFIDAYSNNNFIITTRPGSGIEGFARFLDFKVCALSNDDVVQFTKKIVEDGERRERIIKIVNDPSNNAYIEYLRNPLLLSMFIMAFENHPEIPKKKSSFYRNVFDTLYSKHDGITKGSWPREKLTQLERDDFEKILNIFSYLSLREGHYTFTEEYLTDTLKKVKKAADYDINTEDLIYDLRTTISIMTLDGFGYSFPHRSLQEYFTAQFISDLPSEKKAKAYNNLFKILEKSSADHSFNFWNMCYELDFIDFSINFLIPQLKKFQSLLDQDTDENILRSYFRMLEPAIVLASVEHNSIEREQVRIIRHYNLFSALLDFCNVFDFKQVAKFPINSGANDELVVLFKKKHGKMKHRPIDESLPRDSKVLDILLKFKIVNVIKEINRAISKKIASLEIEISKRKGNIDSILNL